MERGKGGEGVGRTRPALPLFEQGCKRWHRRYERSEWDAFFKLCTVVEEFCFYAPTAEDSTMSELLAEQGATVGGLGQL
jgi:hypothetical protein